MTETNFVDISLNFFESYLSNEGDSVEDFSIDPKYVKAIFLREVYDLNSKQFVEELSDSTKNKIAIQKNIHNSTISDKENELENYEFISRVAERTVHLLLCLSVEVPDFILSSWGKDPDKQIYYNRSQTQTGLRNWVYELITVLSPLSNHYDSIDVFVQDVGFCAHCALLNTAPTGARNTADWMYPRDNISKGSEFMNRIKQMNGSNQKFHKYNPMNLIDSFYSCFNNFISLVSELGYCESKQQVAIDTTFIPTGPDAPESLTTDGSSSGRKPTKYGERRWIYQIATTVTYPSKFILSVEPIYDRKRQNLRLESQLEQFPDLDVDIDTVICDSGYYGRKSIKKLRKHQQEWIIRAENRGDSDIAELINKVKESGNPKSETDVKISSPPVTPKPGAFAYPLEEIVNTTNHDTQATISDSATTNDNNEDELERFLDLDADREVLAYVVGGDVNDAKRRKTQVAYRTRKRIESKFGQIKGNSLVNTESHDPAVRYYVMAMGCMFYNFHFLINRSLSPQYGIPLRNISLEQWLCAIQDVAFSN